MAKAARAETWLTPFGVAWSEAFQTPVVPYGRLAKALKPLVEHCGASPVVRAWKRALASPDRKFLSPERFAERYGDFALPESDAFGYALVSDKQALLADALARVVAHDDSMVQRVAKRCGWTAAGPVAARLAVDLLLGRLEGPWRTSVERFPGARAAVLDEDATAAANQALLDAHLSVLAEGVA